LLWLPLLAAITSSLLQFLIHQQDTTSVVYEDSSSHICGGSMRWIYRKSRDRPWSQVTSPEEVLTGSDRVHMHNRKLCNIRPSGPFDRKWRHPTSPIVWPLMGSLGCAHAQTEVAQYPPFGAFWPDITSPVGLPLEGWGARMRNLKLSNIRSEVPLWCSLGRLRPISSMATGTNPFTGYLPISRHFIFIITFLTNLFCFRICSVVLQGCLRPIIVF
jgi:hypothetical protein